MSPVRFGLAALALAAAVGSTSGVGAYEDGEDDRARTGPGVKAKPTGKRAANTEGGARQDRDRVPARARLGGDDDDHGPSAERKTSGQNDDDDKGGGKKDHDHELETENLFGFTLGSDTNGKGEKELTSETVSRLGKRSGSYRALDQKIEFGFGVTDDLSLSFAGLGDCHRINNVPDLQDVRGRCGFNGFGTEFRWRLLDREKAPFGMTLHVEPSFARFDETSGQVGRVLRSENKLIFDKELIHDRLFGAVNLLYEPERARERFGTRTERSSNAGVAGALSLKVGSALFLGGEARYLRAYEGLALREYSGDAVYLGPTLFAKLGEHGFLSAAWNVQVAGRENVSRRDLATSVADAVEAGDDPLSALPLRPARLNLTNFERHQIRIKVGFSF